MLREDFHEKQGKKHDKALRKKYKRANLKELANNNSNKIFTIKHIGKIIKEQIFTGLLIIFTVI